MSTTSKDRVRIIGNYVSPYVRKVLVCLEQKGIPYEIDPIVPFYGDERFSQLSPLRRIPVYIEQNGDEQVTLCDSSVICEYLEDRHPEPALYPRDPVQRARARWLEEFADTRMGEVLIWRFFNQVAILPAVWGEKGNPEILDKVLKQEIPHVLGYLETQVPASGFLFGTLSVADIAIASFFRTAAFARFRIDAARWPRTAAFVDRVLAEGSFAKLALFEERTVRTPIAQQRAVLAELNAPLTPDTYASPTPQRGLMQI